MELAKEAPEMNSVFLGWAFRHQTQALTEDPEWGACRDQGSWRAGPWQRHHDTAGGKPWALGAGRHHLQRLLFCCKAAPTGSWCQQEECSPQLSPGRHAVAKSWGCWMRKGHYQSQTRDGTAAPPAPCWPGKGKLGGLVKSGMVPFAARVDSTPWLQAHPSSFWGARVSSPTYLLLCTAMRRWGIDQFQ